MDLNTVVRMMSRGVTVDDLSSMGIDVEQVRGYVTTYGSLPKFVRDMMIARVLPVLIDLGVPKGDLVTLGELAARQGQESDPHGASTQLGKGLSPT